MIEREDGTKNAIRRWRDWRGSGFPAGDEDGLVVVTELVSAIVLGDALAAELERVTAALRAFFVEYDGNSVSMNRAPSEATEALMRAALAGGGDAAFTAEDAQKLADHADAVHGGDA